MLKEPEKHLKTKKSIAIRKNSVFTLDLDNTTIESMKADDNGPYVYKGTTTKTYFYDTKDCFTVHKYRDDDESVSYFYNKREGNSYVKQFVSTQKIYDVTRRYRQSKFNPGFTNTIVTVRPMSTGRDERYYLVSYKWNTEPTDDFILTRHGNAKKPSASSYYRQDPSIHHEIGEMVDTGMSNDSIYSKLINKKTITASETIRDPKVISNFRYTSQKGERCIRSDESQAETEAEIIIKYLKNDQFIKIANFSPTEYSTANFNHV